MSNQTMVIKKLSEEEDKPAYLVPLNGSQPILIEGVLNIGRDPSAEISLRDPHVSFRHCRLEKRPTGYFIRDLKSTNGIYLNGQSVTEGKLMNGSRIQIGLCDFVFQTTMPADQLETREDNQIDETHSPIRSRNYVWNIKLQSLRHLALTDLPVFLQGESGTGKEVIARLIHDLKNKHAPFISVNCGALTESLVESELFGHVRGSFTGATTDRKGAFEAAKGGTLFLDEIGDLPLSLQPKLLRALENKEIKPVGCDKVVPTNVRIITATHKNLDHLVADRSFRADLYFRINVVRFQIPPLKQRMEDFEDLLYRFCREFRVRFSVDAIDLMKRHPWPGNIRELRNSISRAEALFPNSYIQAENVRELIDVAIDVSGTSHLSRAVAPHERGSTLLKDVEKEIIKARLIINQGNQRKTANDLGMPKSTLHDRIRAYGIEVKSLFNL